jgi:hypothetical protein
MWPLVISHAADPARHTVDGVTVALCGALMPARESCPSPACVRCQRALMTRAIGEPDALTCPRCWEDRLVELEDGRAYCCVCGFDWRVGR